MCDKKLMILRPGLLSSWFCTMFVELSCSSTVCSLASPVVDFVEQHWFALGEVKGINHYSPNRLVLLIYGLLKTFLQFGTSCPTYSTVGTNVVMFFVRIQVWNYLNLHHVSVKLSHMCIVTLLNAPMWLLAHWRTNKKSILHQYEYCDGKYQK